MLVSDLVVLPVVPGGADVWALQETLTVLEEVREFRPELKAVVVNHKFVAKRVQRALFLAQILADFTVVGPPEVVVERNTLECEDWR